MATKPETLFKNRIRPLLESLPLTIVVKLQQVAIRGDPDFILVVNGWSVWLELKKDAKERLDPLQAYRLLGARRAGAFAWKCTPENWPAIYEFLKALASDERIKPLHLEIPPYVD